MPIFKLSKGVATRALHLSPFTLHFKWRLNKNGRFVALNASRLTSVGAAKSAVITTDALSATSAMIVKTVLCVLIVTRGATSAKIANVNATAARSAVIRCVGV